MITVKNNAIRSSARKVRLVADLIREKSAKESLDILRFLPKKNLSIIVTKLLKSGLAIASERGLDLEKLMIREIYANQGTTLKRIMPRAQGKAFRIKKKTSYLTITIG
jgi:large subunit ribosomal protein L22